MPNWCSVTITVSGDASEIKRFAMDNSPTTDKISLSFNKKIPRPPDQENNWYNWNIQNWGTKWDLTESTIHKISYDTATEIYYDIDTAWAPPTAWFEFVSELYPSLLFVMTYEEPNMDLAGKFEICHDQDIYYDNSWSIAETFQKKLRTELFPIIVNAHDDELSPYQHYDRTQQKFNLDSVFTESFTEKLTEWIETEAHKHIDEFIDDTEDIIEQFEAWYENEYIVQWQQSNLELMEPAKKVTKLAF